MNRAYLKVYAGWIAAKQPVRSRERVRQLFEQWCEPCPLRKDNVCTANGGTVDPTTRFMNFLAWGTSTCPQHLFDVEPPGDRETLDVVETPRDRQSVTVRRTMIVARFPRPVCQWLGPATGITHKGKCQTLAVTLAEHVCFCPERRKLYPRSGTWDFAKCTPTGTCAAQQVIQPCGKCPLYQPQRLIAFFPANNRG